MIIPNYINFKQGLCTDMEYFRYSYAGKEGQVIKRYVDLKHHLRHAFYVVKRPLDNFEKHLTYEFKIYDLYHNGVIEKEVIRENKAEGIEIPSLVGWYEKQICTNTHMKNYISLCRDMNLHEKVK